MLGLDCTRVAIVSYDIEWPSSYAREVEAFSRAFGEFKITFEHIGSTAVPGLASKPIIDIVAYVGSFDCDEDARDVLGGAGYSCLGECGRPDRLFFVKGDRTNTTHHLHLVKAESQYLRDHILVRELLRGDPDLAGKYASLKKELAQKYENDRYSYRLGKGGFLESMLLDAETRNTGITGI